MVMTYYNAQGQPAPDTAWMIINGERVQVQNPAAIEQWRTDNGYTYTERPLPPPPPPPDTTDFDDACAKFRDICYIIRQAIGDPGFKGGFEEMTKLQQAPIYNTIEGLQLANAWSAVNDLCTYEGSKIGLGQPQWWYACWEQEEHAEPEPEEPTTPDTEDLPIEEQEEHIEEPPVEAPGSEPEEPESEPVDVPVAELPDDPEQQEEPSEPATPAIEEEEPAIELPAPEPEEGEDTSEPAPPMPAPVESTEETPIEQPQEEEIIIPEEEPEADPILQPEEEQPGQEV